MRLPSSASHRFAPRFLLPLAVLALAATAGCKAGTTPLGSKGAEKAAEKSGDGKEGDDDDEAPASRAPRKSEPIEADRQVLALQGKVEALEHALANGKGSENGPIYNGHEHLKSTADLERYLPAARANGVIATVFVASSEFTLMGKGEKGEPSMSTNFDELLAAAAKYPTEVIPFFTVDPRDRDKLERAKRHLAAGGKGVKLYSGHSSFYDLPLDDSSMDPLYTWLEETGLPIVWHVNLTKFGTELEHVLDRHPKLNLLIPHYGVYFWKPTKEGGIPALKELLRKHPNVFIDTSLGTREILLDGMAVMESERALFQSLFTEFPDRIIYGTDSVVTGNPEKTTTWFAKVLEVTRDQLERDVFTTTLAAAYSKYWKKGRDADGRYQGLALPKAVLDQVYATNTKRWLRLP